MNLFPDVTLAAELTAVTPIGSTWVWTGKLAGEPLSDVTLAVTGAVTGEIVSANITTGEGRRYFVRPEGSGHVVQEADPAGFPQEMQPRLAGVEEIAVANKAGAMPRAASAEKLADDGSTIDVLVAYTASARAAAGGTTAIANQIALAVTEANQGYANSGVIQRLRLVNTVEVTFDESVGFNATLDALTAGSGPFGAVQTLRNQSNADMVSLWINNASGCGLSWLMQFVSLGCSRTRHTAWCIMGAR
ncbi:MAG: M12 family metallo-peptidase [Bryobacteraceae bacterium]